MEKPLTRPTPSGTLSPGRGLSFLVGAQVMKAALSPRERASIPTSAPCAQPKIWAKVSFRVGGPPGSRREDRKDAPLPKHLLRAALHTF